MPTPTPDELLTKELATYYADPLGFVRVAYLWEQPGTELEHEKGPDENQQQFLIDLSKEVDALAFEWLPHGAFPPPDEKLALDLGSPGPHISTNGQRRLESRDRILSVTRSHYPAFSLYAVNVSKCSIYDHERMKLGPEYATTY